MRCINCGKELPEGTKFCTSCGTPVPVKNNTNVSGKEPVKITPVNVQENKEDKKSFVWKDSYTIILFIIGIIIAALIGMAIKMNKNKTDEPSSKIVADTKQDDDLDYDEEDEVYTESTSNYQKTDNSYQETKDKYDVNIWDNRFAKLPDTVKQKYYVIFYEGQRNKRIEVSVFDIDGELNDNYLVWDGDYIKLHDYSVMKDCDQYYYDGTQWIQFNKDHFLVADYATDIISSNLDVYDKYGYVVMGHITSAGISATIAPYMTGQQDYLLPGSDTRYITKEELAGFDADKCRLARNELYARHGRMFDDEALQNYFNQFSWYVPSIKPADFQESMLNEFEIANRDLIVEYEKEQGFR